MALVEYTSDALLSLLQIHQNYYRRRYWSVPPLNLIRLTIHWPPPPDVTTTDTVEEPFPILIIYCWVRVSGKDQITIVVEDGDIQTITWRVSIAMQIMVMRRWFQLFGLLYYGEPFQLVWLVSVGSVNVNVVPIQLAMLMTADKLVTRGIIHIAFASRLHRNPRLFWTIGLYFRIVMHLGTHNFVAPDGYGYSLVAPHRDRPIMIVDFSYHTYEEMLEILCTNNAMWERFYPSKCARIGGLFQMPIAATDLELYNHHGIHSLAVSTILSVMVNDLPPGGLSNEALRMLSHLPRHRDSGGINGPVANDEFYVDPTLNSLVGAGLNLGQTAPAHPPFLGRLLYIGRCCRHGCPRVSNEATGCNAHEKLCPYLQTSDVSFLPAVCPEIVDIASARHIVKELIFPHLLTQPEDDVGGLLSYFSGQYIRLPSFENDWYHFQDHGMQFCGYSPEFYEYIDQPGCNFFKDLRFFGPGFSEPIPIHEVFRRVLNDVEEKKKFIEQFAWTLLHRVKSLLPFHFHKDHKRSDRINSVESGDGGTAFKEYCGNITFG